MVRKLLAVTGVLLLAAGSLLGIIVFPVLRGDVSPERAAAVMWQRLQPFIPLSPEQAFFVSLIVVLFGVLLTIPWWWQRLRQENVWWEKRDEPLDPPPRAGV